MLISEISLFAHVSTPNGDAVVIRRDPPTNTVTLAYTGENRPKRPRSARRRSVQIFKSEESVHVSEIIGIIS